MLVNIFKITIVTVAKLNIVFPFIFPCQNGHTNTLQTA